MKPEPHRRSALRQRLLLSLFVPLSILLAINVAYDFETTDDPADISFDHALADDAITLASHIRLDQNGTPILDLSPNGKNLFHLNNYGPEYLSAWGPNGQLLGGDATLLPTRIDSNHGLTLTQEQLRGRRIRKASYRIDTAAGPVIVVVAETPSSREQSASHLLTSMIIPNLLFIITTLLLVYFGVRRGLLPLNQLGEEIARRSPHDLSPLPDINIPQEAEPLVNAMNHLMNDVRAATAAQHAFLADAAHQLRTPLAGLQTQLELAAEEIPPEHRERIIRLRNATRRLGHLTHQLLALARSGPDATLAQELRSVNLLPLLEASASQWYDVSLERGIDLGFETAPATVNGSPWMLNELLSNLIDNALHYTPTGGQVTARCGLDAAQRPYIEVEDNGPGIPKDEQTRIFERFYRMPDTNEPGSGLGLAIVKEVAERHNARTDLHSNSQGTRLRVTFPPP